MDKLRKEALKQVENIAKFARIFSATPKCALTRIANISSGKIHKATNHEVPKQQRILTKITKAANVTPLRQMFSLFAILAW